MACFDSTIFFTAILCFNRGPLPSGLFMLKVKFGGRWDLTTFCPLAQEVVGGGIEADRREGNRLHLLFLLIYNRQKLDLLTIGVCQKCGQSTLLSFWSRHRRAWVLTPRIRRGPLYWRNLRLILHLCLRASLGFCLSFDLPPSAPIRTPMLHVSWRRLQSNTQTCKQYV